MQSEEDTADKKIPLGFANLFPVKVLGACLAVQFSTTTCEGRVTA